MFKNILEKQTINGKQFLFVDSDGYLILLDKQPDTYEIINKGCSYKFSFESDQMKLFYKECKLHELVAEIISAELGNELELNCVSPLSVDIAISRSLAYKESTGIIMQNFFDILDPNYTKLVSAKQILIENSSQPSIFADSKNFSIFRLMEAFKNYKDQRAKEGIEVIYSDSFILDHFKLAVFDFLTCEMDRHYLNVEYFFTKQENKEYIELTPIFDNALSFEFGFAGKLAYLLKEEYADEEADFAATYFARQCVFEIEAKEDSNRDFLAHAAKVIVCKPELKDFYSKILAVDFDQLFTMAECTNHRRFGREFRIVGRTAFNHRRTLLKEAVQNEVANRQKFDMQNTNNNEEKEN